MINPRKLPPGNHPTISESFDRSFRKDGVRFLAGVDEAGRGPLAGPVVAAAIILPETADLPGLDDSKRLSPKRRDILFEMISGQALSFGVGVASSDEIDRLNILQASLHAMRLAIEAMTIPPDLVLIDGQHTPGSSYTELPIIDGDAQSFVIAAASVIAKVTRDRMMVAYDAEYPAYGFARHKGYPTPWHLRALCTHGPSPIHRRSFTPVRELLSPEVDERPQKSRE